MIGARSGPPAAPERRSAGPASPRPDQRRDFVRRVPAGAEVPGRDGPVRLAVEPERGAVALLRAGRRRLRRTGPRPEGVRPPALLARALAALALALAAAGAAAQPAAPGDDLAVRIEAQAAARRSGDPAAVAGASRGLATLLLRRIADLRLAAGEAPEAAGLYRRSIELADEPAARAALAAALLAGGRPEEALAEAGRAAAGAPAGTPESARAWSLQARIEIRLGRPDSAERSLRRSLEEAPEPDAAFALGRLLLRRGDRAGAAAVFAPLVEWSGDGAEMHLAIGNAYAETGHLGDAIRELETALERDPGLHRAQLSLGYAYLTLGAGQGSPEAERALRAAAAADPASYDARLYLGQLESLAGRLDEAAVHLRAAAAADPGAADPWLQLGLDAFGAGDAAAEAHLRRGVELAAGRRGRSGSLLPRAQAALARLALGRGDRAEAERLWEARRALLAAEPAGPEAAGPAGAPVAMSPASPAPGPPPPPASLRPPDGLGETDGLAPADGLAPPALPGDERAALLAERRARLEATLAAALNDWGTAEAQRGDPAAALERYREAERWGPETPGLMRNLGLAAFQAGDHAEAARALARAVEADPADRAARAIYGVALASSERWAEAVEAFEGLGEAALEDPRLAYLWALSLARTGRTDAARPILARMRAMPLPPEALLQVAALYREIGDAGLADEIEAEAARRRGGD